MTTFLNNSPFNLYYQSGSKKLIVKPGRKITTSTMHRFDISFYDVKGVNEIYLESKGNGGKEEKRYSFQSELLSFPAGDKQSYFLPLDESVTPRSSIPCLQFTILFKEWKIIATKTTMGA